MGSGKTKRLGREENEMKIKKRCEHCKWWKQPDPTNRTSNAGMCIYLMNDSEDFYARPDQVPTWAVGLSMLTLSFEGESCPVFTKAAIQTD